MLLSHKKRWFCWVFAGHVRRRMRRHFSAVYGFELDRLRAAAAAGPVLLFANHTAWWDSLLLFDLVDARLGLDGYALMDARSLEALPFLGWIGGVGLPLDDHAQARQALTDAAAFLDRAGRLLAFFPQGRERPVTERPLALRGGLAKLLALAPRATALPLALRYEHGRDEKPFAMLRVGTPLTDRTLAGATGALTVTMDANEQALLAGDDRSWPALLAPRSSRWRGASPTPARR